MTILTFSNSDFTKTSGASIKISADQSASSESVYAFNPVLNTFVEIDPLQAWFWDPNWLKDELKAENELRNGAFEEFDNLDDFIDSL